MRSLSAGASLVLCCLGTYLFFKKACSSYPIQDWLFWTYATLWGWLLFFSVSCLSIGAFVLRSLLRFRRLPVLESVTLSMAVGTVTFAICMYVGGTLSVFNPLFAVLMPLALMAIGARDGIPLLLSIYDECRQIRHSSLTLLVTSVGVLCLGLVYMSIATPDGLSFDAIWYHQTIAQDYARWGGIRPFLANYNFCLPHLASILYTWGYLLPGLARAERWMCAQHLEFCLFLWTLVGVAAAVQRMVGNWTLKASWVAFFLFPCIFVYDSNLGAAADHILAFFAVPILLATLHVLRSFRAGNCVLLAVLLAGATLTKYQSIYLVVPAVLMTSVAWCWSWIWLTRDESHFSGRITKRDLYLAPAILIGVTSLLVAPHFLKNILFYKNPVYPIMMDVFTNSTPTVPGAKLGVDHIFTEQYYVPTGSLYAKLKHAVELFFTFSFKTHYSFNGDRPFFGSLFTLLLPGLLFLPGRRTTAAAATMTTCAILVWGVTFNVDRNLQAVTPLMVCVTAAIIIKIWQLGWFARLGLVPLVALQFVWGADIPFYSGNGRLSNAIELAKSGFDHRASTRFDGYLKSHVEIGNALPKDATLMLHDILLSLGIDRNTLLDVPGKEGLISYRSSRTPRELYEYFHSLGITHILEPTDRVPDIPRQDQVLYYTFTSRYTVPVAVNAYALRLMAMPSTPPPIEAPYQVLCLRVGGYSDGLYPIEALYKSNRIPEAFEPFSSPVQPATESNYQELLAAASAVLISNTTDFRQLGDGFRSSFEEIRRINEVTLYVRRR
jgi:hypothetical protein